jgi:PAS domain S-box-containing protein
VIGIVLSVSVFIIVLDWEHQRIQTEFKEDAEERFEALKREIESDLHVLDSIEAFYTHAHKIGRSEFRHFVKHFLLRHPSIQALEWIPRIPNNQRETYEKAAKQDGFPNFQITDRKTQGKMIRAPQRNEYFPVYFVEPYKGNEIALGFDLGSEQARLEALERSRDNGKMVATARIKLVQETSGQFGFLVFEPIYREDVLMDSVESRREKLEGFALGVFRIGDIVEKSVSYLTTKGIHFYLYDESGPMQDRLLYFHQSRLSKAVTMSKRSEEAKSETGFQYAKTLNVAGWKWMVWYTPLPEYIAAKKTWQPLGVLLVGLLFTASWGTYLLINIKRTERIEKLIKERTDELSIANEELRHEISERRYVEEALRESEEKYRSLVANAMDAIFIVQEGLIKFPNPITLALTGYSQEELTTLPILTFIHPDDRDMVFDNHRRRLEGEEVPSTYSFRIIKKKGEELWGQINAALITWDGKPAVLCFIRDITERKQIEQEKANVEEQLRQSQKIEAIGRLAGGIAHDFNNLLTVISGNCQLSLLELKEGDPLKGNIDQIKRASEKAADLTRQLLAFSRRQILEMRVLNLNSLLMDLDKMLHRLIGEDIELITLLADDLGRVKTDPGWVEQIIMNLSVNARDAMPNGGKLTIETSNVELDEAYARGHIAVKPGRYVMLSVSDTGVGMTPEVRQQVFEPFFTTKEKGKGTGLGLSTVYGIVKLSGGNIWVYSEPGLGTTFKIYLPRVEEPFEEMREKVTTEEFPRGNETILVVEDEEDVLRLAVRALERQGYRVLEASCGDDALVLSKEPIHMILTDVVMPGMSGRQLADRLMPLHPTMKVLYMSGYTDNAIVHHGVLEEGVNYIQKPFTIDKLIRKVREILDKDLKHVV